MSFILFRPVASILPVHHMGRESASIPCLAIVYTVYAVCALCLSLCRRPVPPMHQVEGVAVDPLSAIVNTVCGVCAFFLFVVADRWP